MAGAAKSGRPAPARAAETGRGAGAGRSGQGKGAGSGAGKAGAGKGAGKAAPKPPAPRGPASMRLALWVAGAVFLLDQVLKFVVVHAMNLDRRLAIDVWPPFLNLRMAWNQGVNFGLFSGESGVTRWLLIALALAISAWVWIWVRRQPWSAPTQISAGLLVGGAVGNVVDRIFYGAVADFLNMSCCGWQNPWAFNLADIAIFAGALGLVVFAGREGQAAPGPRGN